VLGPIVAFSLISLLMGKTSGSLRFDEVGAQILIVLLLALAIDARFSDCGPVETASTSPPSSSRCRC
jgi:hypothetical protein